MVEEAYSKVKTMTDFWFQVIRCRFKFCHKTHIMFLSVNTLFNGIN